MPLFKAEVEVDFEVFCTCGAGLCGQSQGRQSRTRNEPQVEVTPCEDCLSLARKETAEEAKEEIREEMQEIITDLQSQITALRGVLAEIEKK